MKAGSTPRWRNESGGTVRMTTGRVYDVGQRESRRGDGIHSDREQLPAGPRGGHGERADWRRDGRFHVMATTVDSAGRVVIPKAIREAAQLRPGTRVHFRLEPVGVLIEPEPLSVRFERRGTVVVAVPRTPVPALSAEEVAKTIDELREGRTDTHLDP